MNPKSANQTDNPIEKMTKKGIKELSNAELITILMGTSTKEDTMDIARSILSSCDHSLQNLSKYPLSKLEKFKGIGKIKAAQIMVALELGKRVLYKEEKKIIKESYDIFSLTRSSLGALAHEEFWVFYVDHGNKILHKSTLSKGGLTGTLVDIRLLMKQALDVLATGIVLCHNHPSGNIQPSTADKNITQKIKNACETLDLRLLDHLIVTPMAYFSFLDEGVL